MIEKFIRIKNKNLFFSIFFSSIFYLVAVKFMSFNFLKNNLESKKTFNKKKYKLNEILNYEKKISEKLNIKQCLIRMCVLFSILKKNAYKPILFVGVKDDSSFKSHAWLSVQNKFIDLENRTEYKKILELS